MKGVWWDPVAVHRLLLDLTVQRSRFRIGRTCRRMASPRQLAANTLAVIFFGIYLLNGALILATREPADPGRLQLWLSGGMVLYVIYHSVRCGWSAQIADLALTPAEQLWLGGAPLQRSSLAVYHLSNLVIATFLKTILLGIVLWRDVPHCELLLLGVFTSLLLLELVRMIIERSVAGLDESGRRWFRLAVTSVAAATVLHVLTRLLATTPWGAPTWQYLLNSFRCLGATAASAPVQWLALPWIPAAELAVAPHYNATTALQLLVTVSLVPLTVMVLIAVDDRVRGRQQEHERKRLHQWRAAGTVRPERSPHASLSSHLSRRLGGEEPMIERLDRRLPNPCVDCLAIMGRQWVSVRRYAGTIAVSFAVPALLALSPLITGGDRGQWFYVVGGVALCTVLLAPPALKLDFRRDLRRMLLLRAIPVRPLAMVIGQLALPVLITVLFQTATMAVAATVTRPGWWQFGLWSGMLSALAVFTFAGENALFLAYPHHERNEGISVLLRTKLTFLGKATVIGGALGLLLVWATFCHHQLPAALAVPALVTGAITVTWTAAAVALTMAAWCWQRFDIAEDIPPQ